MDNERHGQGSAMETKHSQAKRRKVKKRAQKVKGAKGGMFCCFVCEARKYVEWEDISTMSRSQAR